ncbi:hypothetical protein Tco_0567111 [Tanacetum coccineum]
MGTSLQPHSVLQHGKSSEIKKKSRLIREELSEESLVKNSILIIPRPIIKTLKYGDQYKKVLEAIFLDKLKLDGELELEEEDANEEMIKEYKAVKEKEDPSVFVLPIRLEGRFDTHALANTGFRNMHYHSLS